MRIPIDLLKIFSNPTLYGYRYRNTNYNGNTVEIIRKNTNKVAINHFKYNKKINSHYKEGITLNLLYETPISETMLKGIEKVL